MVTFSWQKVLGGEAAHGMLILSPRAVARLESYTPPRPLPKIFRMTKKGKLDQELFEGATINTPSLLATEDYLDALKWGDRIGGLAALHARANANAGVLTEWVARTPWVDFLVADAAIRSNTSVCLKVVDERVTSLPQAAKRSLPRISPRSWRRKAWRSMRHRIGPRRPDCASGVALRSSKAICKP